MAHWDLEVMFMVNKATRYRLRRKNDVERNEISGADGTGSVVTA